MKTVRSQTSTRPGLVVCTRDIPSRPSRAQQFRGEIQTAAGRVTFEDPYLPVVNEVRVLLSFVYELAAIACPTRVRDAGADSADYRWSAHHGADCPSPVSGLREIGIVERYQLASRPAMSWRGRVVKRISWQVQSGYSKRPGCVARRRSVASTSGAICERRGNRNSRHAAPSTAKQRWAVVNRNELS